jgi:hypothetical protein
MRVWTLRTFASAEVLNEFFHFIFLIMILDVENGASLAGKFVFAEGFVPIRHQTKQPRTPWICQLEK